MKGIMESIDRMQVHLDRVLSNGRLKQSLRRELLAMRDELAITRAQASKPIFINRAAWVMQLLAFLARVSELVEKYKHH